MQANINKVIHVKLKWLLATLLTRMDPCKYTKFITKENGKKVMYRWLVKALVYGTLQAALLFWKDLSGYLIQQGFKLNLYDSCMANKPEINGSQCTILWCIDDLKISHVSDMVLDEFIADLNE